MSDVKTAISQIPDKLGNANRGNDTVFDGKQLTVTLEQINGAIMGYLTDSIIPTIKSNGTALVVPVL